MQTRTVKTDINGKYMFGNPPPGDYTVTPVATNGYIFSPTNALVTVCAPDCVVSANFIARPRGVQLVALEVVQVIQDWSNSVRLIKDKETYVRAHLQLTNSVPVLLQGPRLHGGAGGPLSPLPPGSLLVQTTNAADRAVREHLTNSFLFRLPPAWLSGTLNLRFECTNNVTVMPTNVVPPNSTVQVTFVPAPALRIKVFPIHWTNAAGAYQHVSAANLADVPRRLLSLYPVPRVDALFAPAMNLTNRTPPNAYDLLDQLGLLLPADSSRIYHGAVAGAMARARGLGHVPGKVSLSLMPSNTDFYGPPGAPARQTISHEIGHNLGRQHTVSDELFGTNALGEALGGCREYAPAGTTTFPLYQTVAGVFYDKPALGPMNSGSNALIYGLDTLTLRSAPIINPLASPYEYFDVMSYCHVHPLGRWISTANYNELFDSINSTFGPAPAGSPPPGPPPPPGANDWLIIRGSVNFTLNTAQFLPFLTVGSANTPPSPPPGDYHLVLYNDGGGILQDIAFEPARVVAEDEGDRIGSFIVPVLADPAIRRIALWNGADLLLDLTGSANAPSLGVVTISSTNGGAFTGSGLLNISWSGSDADPNPQLTYLIQYSPDNGATWESMAVDWPEPNYSVDSYRLLASTQGLIRIIASDGFNSSLPASSSIFTLLPHPPVIHINTPLNGSSFIGDEQIFLDATALDLQDGPLQGINVQWSSSRDGALGDGPILNFEAVALSEGRHVITVVATNSFGLTNSATFTIFVLRVPPPQLAIRLNGAQTELVWSAGVTKYVLEASGSLVAADWTTVTNTPVAVDSEQHVRINIAPTNRFFRLRLP